VTADQSERWIDEVPPKPAIADLQGRQGRQGRGSDDDDRQSGRLIAQCDGRPAGDHRQLVKLGQFEIAVETCINRRDNQIDRRRRKPQPAGNGLKLLPLQQCRVELIDQKVGSQCGTNRWATFEGNGASGVVSKVIIRLVSRGRSIIGGYYSHGLSPSI
jgi:hypothetical protein